MQTGHNNPKPIEQMEINPIRFCVLIQPSVVEDKSAGGLFLPDSAREKQQYAIDRGEIIAMSDNAFLDEGMWSKRPRVGDMVLFDKYAGAVIHKGEGRDRKIYRLCNDTEILAIFKEA